MTWYTRSGLRLNSAEVLAIESGEFALHVFAKKDDLEQANHYYLGQAVASNPELRSMRNSKGEPTTVVRFRLRFDKPIDAAVFDYFEPVVTD